MERTATIPSSQTMWGELSKLCQRIHRHLREKSIAAGKYDKRTASSILADWGRRALMDRQAILRSLKGRLNSTPVPIPRRPSRLDANHDRSGAAARSQGGSSFRARPPHYPPRGPFCYSLARSLHFFYGQLVASGFRGVADEQSVAG